MVLSKTSLAVRRNPSHFRGTVYCSLFLDSQPYFRYVLTSLTGNGISLWLHRWVKILKTEGSVYSVHLKQHIKKFWIYLDTVTAWSELMAMFLFMYAYILLIYNRIGLTYLFGVFTIKYTTSQFTKSILLRNMILRPTSFFSHIKCDSQADV